MTNNLRFISLNCRGLSGQQKRRDVMDYLKSLPADIVLIQDTHVTDRTTAAFNTLWRGKCYHACGAANSRGTAILIRSSIDHEVISQHSNPDGNFVAIACKINTSIYTIVSLYGPNRDDVSLFEDLDHCLELLPTDNLIIGGDHNMILGDLMLNSNYARQYNVRARKYYLNMLDKYNLVDVWRHFNPVKRQFTWHRTNPLQYGRIDMFVISENLLNTVANTNIEKGYRTDHCMLSMSINQPQQQKGPSLYKFNESLLSNEDYIETIIQCIIDTVKQYAVPIYTDTFFTNPLNYRDVQLTIDTGLFYDTLIMMIRGETVKFSKRVAKQKRAEESQLLAEVKSAQDKFDQTKSHSDLVGVEIAENNLERARESRIKGLIIRSRATWHEQGERSTKYFLSLEKCNATRKSVQYLNVDDRLIANKHDILNVFTEHFVMKYTLQPRIIYEMRKNISRFEAN